MSASQSKVIRAAVLFSRVALAFAVVAMLATFPALSFSQTAGGVSSSAPSLSAAAISVTITPASVEVPIGMQQQFTATVTGTSNTGVTWSVNGEVGGNATVGTISSSGLYTAPAKLPGSYHALVRATSVVDAAQSASARVLILCGPVPPTDALFTLSTINTSTSTTYQVSNYNPDFKGTEPKPAGTYTVLDLGAGEGSFPSALAVGLTGETYVASVVVTGRQSGIGQISTYCPDATGAAQPIRSFLFENGLGQRIAVDPVGNLYTAVAPDYFTRNLEIDEYPAGSGSAAATPPTVSPLRTISGPDTELYNPVGLAVDPQNSQVFVGDQAQILIFNSNQSGDAKPVRTIANTAGGLLDPIDTAVDASGNVYVLYEADNRSQVAGSVNPYGPLAIAVYAPDATMPSRVISGPATQLGTYFGTQILGSFPGSTYSTALAVDPSGNIYVASTGSGQSPTSGYTMGTEIAIFNTSADGNVAPTRAIDVTALVGGQPTYTSALAADSKGNVYLGNVNVGQGGGGIYIFGPSGTLTTHIPTSQSGLGDVSGLAIYAQNNDSLVAQSITYNNPFGPSSGQTALFIYPNAGGTGTPTKIIPDGNSIPHVSFNSVRIAVNASGIVFAIVGGPSYLKPNVTQVDEFSLNGSSGTPIASFSDRQVRFDSQVGIAVDAAGRVYVASLSLNTVYVYSPDVAGANVSPIATYFDYTGSTINVSGLAFDSTGTLYSTSLDTNSVSIYPKGASKPSRTIVGPNTLLFQPTSVSVDNDGSIYVLDEFGVNVFAPDADGNVAPIRRIIKTLTSRNYGEFIFDIAVGPGPIPAP